MKKKTIIRAEDRFLFIRYYFEHVDACLFGRPPTCTWEEYKRAEDEKYATEIKQGPPSPYIILYFKWKSWREVNLKIIPSGWKDRLAELADEPEIVEALREDLAPVHFQVLREVIIPAFLKEMDDMHPMDVPGTEGDRAAYYLAMEDNYHAYFSDWYVGHLY